MIANPRAVRSSVATANFQYSSGMRTRNTSMATGAVKKIPDTVAKRLVMSAKVPSVRGRPSPMRMRSWLAPTTALVTSTTRRPFQKMLPPSVQPAGVIQVTIRSRAKMYELAINATGAYHSVRMPRRVSNAVSTTNTAKATKVEKMRSNLPSKSPIKSSEIEAIESAASRIMLTFRKVESVRGCGAPPGALPGAPFGLSCGASTGCGDCGAFCSVLMVSSLARIAGNRHPR